MKKEEEHRSWHLESILGQLLANQKSVVKAPALLALVFFWEQSEEERGNRESLADL